MDKLTFFSQCLSLLGEQEYVLDSPAARTCDLWFPSVMLEAVSYGPWSFATKETVLECPEKDGRFTVPDDCLKLLNVEARHWRMAGRTVVCEECPSRLQVRFLSNDLALAEMLPDNAPLFVEAVKCLLAAKMATTVGELSFPPEEVPPLPEGCLFVWWAAGQPRELARLARQFASRGFTHVAWQRFLRGPQVHVFPIDQLTNNTKR